MGKESGYNAQAADAESKAARLLQILNTDQLAAQYAALAQPIPTKLQALI